MKCTNMKALGYFSCALLAQLATNADFPHPETRFIYRVIIIWISDINVKVLSYLTYPLRSKVKVLESSKQQGCQGILCTSVFYGETIMEQADV